MKRWIVAPIVWGVDLLVRWAGAAIDAASEFFGLEDEDE